MLGAGGDYFFSAVKFYDDTTWNKDDCEANRTLQKGIVTRYKNSFGYVMMRQLRNKKCC